MKRLIACILLLPLIFCTTFPVQSESGIALDEVASTIEELLNSVTYDDKPIRDRLVQLESILLATDVTGPLTDRLERLRKFLLTNDEYGPSVLYKVNALEWQVFRAIKDGPLIPRIEEIETAVYGEIEEGGIFKRVESLVVDIMPGGQVSRNKVLIPKGTLIKVRLLTQINSSTVKVGQVINCEVVDPIIIDNNLVIPADSKGFAFIEEVHPPGRFGINGKIKMSSFQLRSVDGTFISIGVSERIPSFNETQAITLGLTALGFATLGPAGILTGAFVKGKDLILPIGSEFYVEVFADQEINGIPVNM